MSDIFADYSFGGWLRRFRYARDITLRGFAEKMHMSPSTVSKVERSFLAPPQKKSGVARYANALNLTRDEREILETAAFSFHVGMLKKRWEK